MVRVNTRRYNEIVNKESSRIISDNILWTVINKAVKRNIERFPEDFVFRLTKVEYDSVLRSQIVTLKLQRGKFSKYLPYAFTEQGVAML